MALTAKRADETIEDLTRVIEAFDNAILALERLKYALEPIRDVLSTPGDPGPRHCLGCGHADPDHYPSCPSAHDSCPSCGALYGAHYPHCVRPV